MAISPAEMIRRIQRLIPQLEKEAERQIIRSPELIKAKVNELKRGENPEGGRIGFYRSPAYRLFKKTVNPLANGTVDLILTGSFSSGLGLEKVGSKKFLFDSSDDKAPMLFEKYGQENRSLNIREWQRIQKEVIYPQYLKWIKRQLGQ